MVFKVVGVLVTLEKRTLQVLRHRSAQPFFDVRFGGGERRVRRVGLRSRRKHYRGVGERYFRLGKSRFDRRFTAGANYRRRLRIGKSDIFRRDYLQPAAER